MLEYLTGVDWEQFYKDFPDAYRFLTCHSLRRELDHLTNWEGKGLLNQWQKNRLAELREWNRITCEILTCRKELERKTV